MWCLFIGNELHSPQLYLHALRVASRSADIARQVGLDADVAYRCGSLHDVGKVLVPLSILHKSGPLSDDERAIMDSHPRDGCELIPESFGIERYVALTHHEHQIRSYPRSKDVPILIDLRSPNVVGQAYSQVIGAADLVDALWEPRPYKEGMRFTQIQDVSYQQFLGEPQFLVAAWRTLPTQFL